MTGVLMCGNLEPHWLRGNLGDLGLICRSCEVGGLIVLTHIYSNCTIQQRPPKTSNIGICPCKYLGDRNVLLILAFHT